jgi:hypothetical protein
VSGVFDSQWILVGGTFFFSLKDLVVRQEMNRLVTDLVNLDKVRSLLKMISLRRRFLLAREQALNAPRGT